MTFSQYLLTLNEWDFLVQVAIFGTSWTLAIISHFEKLLEDIVVLWFGSQDGSENRIFQGRRMSGCHTRISLVGVEEEVCSRYQNKVSVCFAIKDEGNSSMWSISFQKLSSSGLKFCQNPIPLHNYPASFHPC